MRLSSFDFPVKAPKKMIFLLFMISIVETLRMASLFEMIEFRDVFCGDFLFEIILIRIAKSPFHMIRKMISFRNVTEGEKSPIISKRNYPLYFEETVIPSYQRERTMYHIEVNVTVISKRLWAHHFKMTGGGHLK